MKRTAEDQRLLDEQEEYYLSALEGENGAREKVNTTKEQAAAAKAKIQRVDADIAAAKANIEVADAELATSRVWVAYGTIKSPYTGVIAQRGYKEGDFIKTGDVAGNVPIVTVSAIDKMRVVIPVPDRDVPFVVPENDLAPVTARPRSRPSRSTPSPTKSSRAREGRNWWCRGWPTPRTTRRGSCTRRLILSTRTAASNRGCMAAPG